MSSFIFNFRQKNPADRFRPAFQRTRRTYHRIFSMSSFIFNFRQKNPADRFRPAVQRIWRIYRRFFSLSSFIFNFRQKKIRLTVIRPADQITR